MRRRWKSIRSGAARLRIAADGVMRIRILGRTGLRVSEVGFGGAPAGIPHYIEAWDTGAAAERESVARALDRALDLGINYLDTAPGYGAGAGEEIYGAVVGRRREEC